MAEHEKHSSDTPAGVHSWRNWTSADGSKSQEAAFVSTDGAIVHVLTRDGKQAQLAIALLSESDRDYVASKANNAANLFEVLEPQKPASRQQADASQESEFPPAVSDERQNTTQWPTILLSALPGLFYIGYRISGGLPSASEWGSLIYALVLAGVIWIGYQISLRIFPDPELATGGSKTSGRRIARGLTVGIPLALLVTAGLVAALVLTERL